MLNKNILGCIHQASFSSVSINSLNPLWASSSPVPGRHLEQYYNIFLHSLGMKNKFWPQLSKQNIQLNRIIETLGMIKVETLRYLQLVSNNQTEKEAELVSHCVSMFRLP